MAMKASLFVLIVLTASSALLCLSPGAAAATSCNAMQLTPCAPAIIGNGSPTPACCGRLKAHPSSCFCQYKKDPNLQRYVNSKNGKKVFAACKVPLPRC